VQIAIQKILSASDAACQLGKGGGSAQHGRSMLSMIALLGLFCVMVYLCMCAFVVLDVVSLVLR